MNTPLILFNSILKYPERLAIIDDAGSYTYKELFNAIKVIGANLQAKGVIKGDRVGIKLDRVKENIATYLACLYIGAVAVPISITYPEERIKYIIDDSNPKYVVDDKFIQSLDNSLKVKEVEYGPKDPCYIIYTSGSTGNPKGVIHPYQTLNTFIQAQKEYLESIGEGNNTVYNYAVVSPFSFVASWFSIMLSLYCNNTVYLVKDSVIRDANLLSEYFAEHEITASIIPVRLATLVLAKYKGLKYMYVGSERVTNLYLKNTKLICCYGSSETWPGVIQFLIDKPYDNTPIGKETNYYKAYILDDSNNEVDEGELCITGELFLGYNNLPEQTSKVLYPNPFKDKDGHSDLYRTGDIAKKGPDGNLIFVNRKDWMVKINGQRVELQEIEAVIKSINGIDNAVVKDFTGPNGQLFLAGYYVAKTNIKDEDIYKVLKSKLPNYMVPSYLVKLDKMPENANGKLDRKALPMPSLESFKKDYEAPTNEVETKLCNAFEKILKVEKVGVNDDFFYLGGDSIKMMELQVLLEDLNISTKNIYDGRTPKGISLYLNKSSKKIKFVREDKKAYKIASSQLGVYLEIVGNPNQLKYNNPLMTVLDKSVDFANFSAAVEKAFNNHDSYKCVIDDYEGYPSMIRKTFKFEMPVYDGEPKDLLDKLIKPFDIKNGPLYRVYYIRGKDHDYFLFDAHHLIFDGTSFSILLKEISALYDGKDIEKEKVSIFDIPAYEEKVSSSDEYKEAEKVYAEDFDGEEFSNNIAIDMDSDANAAEEINLSTKGAFKFENVSDFVKTKGITENTLFLAAYIYTLAKFNGDDKSFVCVGESGRHDPLLNTTGAMLVKTIPMNFDLTKFNNVDTYLREVENKFRKYVNNDIYPFSQLAKKYGFKDDFTFVYQGRDFIRLTLKDKVYPIEKIKVDSAISNLVLMVFKNEDNYSFNLTYRSDLFYKSVMESFIDVYLKVLSEFLTKEAFDDISLVSDSCKEKLTALNNRDVDYKHGTIVDMFMDVVNKYPDTVAVVNNDKKYTFKQENEIANKIANHILSFNFPKTDLDIGAVLIDRNEYMSIATIGVLKSGLGVQPIDSTYPRDRINFMLNDSGAKILITTKALRPLADEYNGEVLFLEDIQKLKDVSEPKANIRENDVAVMLYTSGTTGKPKGVILEHGNFVALMAYELKYFELKNGSRLATYASFGFDASMQDILNSICNGVSLYIISEDIRLDMDALDEFYIKNKITHGMMTTQVGRKFIQVTKAKDLKYFMVGGEKLTPVYVDNGVKLVNAYGPTENTVFVTAFTIDKLYKRVPIGKINDNLKCYVVDKNLKLLPFGIPGELLIAGDQVGRGYHHRDDANAKAFISNPFDNDKGYQRIYRTGDVVRLLPDGNVDFIGRNDGQVKIRGFRIELSEIEKVIHEFEGIKDVTVQAFDKVSGGKYVCAYIVSDKEINQEDLKAFILASKPPYMVPEVIMQIDKIPLNQNQKVNKRALPEPVFQVKAERKNTSNCDSYIVSKLRPILINVIGNDAAGFEDDLFNYGLTSISLVDLSANINKEFNISISIKDLLKEASLKHIEELIVTSLMNRKDTSKEVKEKELKKEYLLSETQNGIYVEYIKDKNALNYNIPSIRTFDKKVYTGITAEDLKEAVCKVINAHPALKSTIASNANNDIVMYPHNDAQVEVRIEKVDANKVEEFAKSLVKPFDLSKSLYNAVVIDSDNLYLFFDAHHIMYDGSSLSVFTQDLDKALKGEEIDKETYSIFDVSDDEKALLKSDEFVKAKDYYNTLLSVVDGSTQIIEECYIKDSKKAEYDLVTSDVDIKAINKVIKDKQISDNAFYLSVMGILLGKYTYNQITCFTTVYNGRKDVKESNTIGMLVKTLPFVADLSKNPTIDDYLVTSKTQILNNMANDIYSFANISKDCNISADFMFIYQGRPSPIELKGLQVDDTKALLSIELRNDDDKLYFHCEFDEGKYSKTFIERFIKAYINTTNSILKVKNVDDVIISDTNDEKEIFALVDKDAPFDKTPVISVVEESMKKYPDKVMIVYEDISITYGQMDIITKNIAGYINSLGIKNDDPVAIMVPRGQYMAICALGVLRSGAGYQPLDTSYPKDRLNFMIKDSNAKLLITSKELRPLVDEYNKNVLYIEDIETLPKVDTLNVKHGLHDLFIMLYTSGTTGLPKGVMLENINLCAMTAHYAKICDINHDTIATTYASFGFDACLGDFYPTFKAGATLHIISEDLRLNFAKLVKYLEDNKVTNGIYTTQVGRQVALTSKSPYLKCIGMGGEKLVPFDPAGYDRKIRNMYGPSECTLYSNDFVVDKLYRRIPIGQCNDNLKVYVVDKNLNLLPIGATGELIIAGQQVGRGYLNRPEKNAQAFIKNPFSSDENYVKAYRTGDVVRMLEDGSIDFIGRNDGQVKVRGFRIELSEVEEIIRRFPDIDDVTTNAYDDPAGGKYVCAYIVSKKKIDINELNKFISSEKPPYIVPKITMQIDKIPLNVNSKVDKRKLPVPDLSSMQSEYVEPANDLEKEFAEVFAKILGLKKVGATDDFFALGGTSIGAAQIVSHAFTKGYDIVFKNVFENSTPRALSEFIAESNNLTLETTTTPTPETSVTILPEETFKHNIIPEIKNIEQNPLGGVLLLGATGFLGMHILKELMDNSEEKVYCVVRENELNKPQDRLMILLEYYFENTYEDLIGSRLFVIKGDLLDPDLGDKIKELDFKTIINCAASVKHFSADDSIQKTNAGGVANLIKIALAQKKKLIQVSTLSVSGESVNNSVPRGFKLKENMLDIGQALDNKYIKSKFDAESEIRDAIKQGLVAKIIRVGNLMSRHSDGEFQINFFSNNFMNTFKAFQLLHCIPYDNLIQNIEFSPIDLVSKAVVLLARTNDKFNVYHVNNIHTIQMNNIVEQMNKQNIIINRVSGEEFGARLNEELSHTKDTQAMNSLLAYRTNRNENRSFVETDNSFTLEVLYRLGFVWPLPDEQYLEKLINSLVGLDFFERK